MNARTRYVHYKPESEMLTCYIFYVMAICISHVSSSYILLLLLLMMLVWISSADSVFGQGFHGVGCF
jgi:hypothetical protein